MVCLECVSLWASIELVQIIMLYNNYTFELISCLCSRSLVVPEIIFKVVVITSSVAELTFAVAEITFKVDVITCSVVNITLY